MELLVGGREGGGGMQSALCVESNSENFPFRPKRNSPNHVSAERPPLGSCDLRPRDPTARRTKAIAAAHDQVKACGLTVADMHSRSEASRTGSESRSSFGTELRNGRFPSACSMPITACNIRAPGRVKLHADCLLQHFTVTKWYGCLLSKPFYSTWTLYIGAYQVN
ncbi:hypothetical protein BDV95DRAFT_52623 [Massariosphaeria phaeospora]|uniref:Uncharacterized protein n=1 Tax=Massariosphaeria phaeospora TaxID=100035 RepID=A0A7C8M7E8_9PLEO|nr:hypothetical protein BDV95DRAFT_52623 [Massariosphaeria phaeospora]